MSLRFLVLMLTTRCGLGCEYCYLGDLDLGDMDERTLVSAISRLGAGSGPLHIQLSGGEPTLRPDLVFLAAKLAKELGRPATVSLQTNGTLIDLGLAKKLAKSDLGIGVSVDGPPAINDVQRGRTRELLSGLGALEAAKASFRATTVVTRRNAASLFETALMLSGFAMCRGLGLDLLVRRGKGPEAEAARPDDLEAGAERLVKTLAGLGGVRKTPLALRELELVRRAYQNGAPESFCHASKGQALAVRPDGAIFPCGQLASSPAAQTGSLNQKEPIFSKIYFNENPGPASIKAKPFPRAGDGGGAEDYTGSGSGLSAMSRGLATGIPPRPDMSPECPDCQLRGRCPGECPSRLMASEETPPLACRMYRGLARADGFIS